MVAYLFAAAELTCAIGSAVAIAARDTRTILAVAIGSTVYQSLVGLAGLYGTIREGIPAMLPNVILHGVIVVGFLVLISRARKLAGRQYPRRLVMLGPHQKGSSHVR
jgi:ABC-type proline/glycine betaine transport system permease subunit